MSWRKIRGSGVELAAKSFGRGELAIILGGGPGLSCEYVVPLAEMLADLGWQAVCFQPRGMAPSTWPDSGSFSLAEMADDVDAIRVHHGAERVHIVAHSFGGYVAWAFLKHHERVASLTLIGACAPTADANAKGQRHLRARVVATLGTDRLRPTHPTARFLADVPAYFHHPTLEIPSSLLATTTDDSVHSAVMSAKSDLADFAEHAARFPGRAIVVIGESDPLGLEVAEASVASLSRAQVTLDVIPEAGHFPWLECGPRFSAALARLLA